MKVEMVHLLLTKRGRIVVQKPQELMFLPIFDNLTYSNKAHLSIKVLIIH